MNMQFIYEIHRKKMRILINVTIWLKFSVILYLEGPLSLIRHFFSR